VDGPTHANHALNPAVAQVAAAPSDGSLSRQARAGSLMAGGPPRTAQDLMRMLGDHGAEGQDICVHPEGEEDSAIQFAMVCDVEAGVMWLAPGQPCSTPFQELRLDDLW
jgi:isopenicillin-N N-acyltransferase like protein